MFSDSSRVRARLGPRSALRRSRELARHNGCKSDSEDQSPLFARQGPGSVDPDVRSDPLRTGLDPLWNGNSVDAYDCPILEYTAQYDELTP